MSFQQRDNSGALFKNAEKRSERGPDYSGKAMIDGVEYFMDAWLKQGDRTWMSFSFKKMDRQSSQPYQAPQKTHGDRPGGPKNRPAPTKTNTGFDDIDSDIPW